MKIEAKEGGKKLLELKVKKKKNQNRKRKFFIRRSVTKKRGDLPDPRVVLASWRECTLKISAMRSYISCFIIEKEEFKEKKEK